MIDRLCFVKISRLLKSIIVLIVAALCSIVSCFIQLLKKLVEMGEKDIEEKKGKKPSSLSNEATSQSPPPLERKISLATADDSSDSEKEDEEDGEVGGASGSGEEGGVSREGVADSADSADSGSEKSTPPVTEYIVNVVSAV